MIPELLKDAIEHYRAHPWRLICDVAGAAALTAITVGLMYAPILIGY